MAGINFNISASNDDFLKKWQETRNAILNGGKEVEKQSQRIENTVKRLGGLALGLFSVDKAFQFAQSIVSVRKEVQMLESSFEVLLGNKQKADQMLGEIKKIALDSPLELSHVSKAAQTLLSFNVDAKKVIPTLKQLGDISMGDGNRFQSLALAFAQMSSAGKLMGQDLLQMINAGFNPLQIMAEKTGKSITVLKDEMSKGAISSEMVAEAFRSATEEGGKFYGMMQKQSEGIAGKQAELEDAFRNMYNELGESSEGIITSMYGTATSLVENYEKVGLVLGGLIALYGVHKASLMATTAIDSMVAASNGVLSRSLATRFVATEMLQKAQARLNASMLANPYVLATAAVIALGYGIYSTITELNAFEKAQQSVNSILEENSNKIEDIRGKSNSLRSIINDETRTIYDQVKAYKELQNTYPSVLSNIDIHSFKAMAATQKQKLLNNALNSLDTSNFEGEISKYKRLLNSLEEQGNSWNVMSELGYSTWEKMNAMPPKVLDHLKEIVKQLEEEKRTREGLRIETEFQSKSEGERLGFYKNQLHELEKQRSALLENESKSKDISFVTKDIGDKASITSKNIFEWGNAFSSASFELGIIEGQITQVSKKINQMGGKDGIQIIKNKEYWEQIKKDATDKFNLLDQKSTGSEEWHNLKKNISEANQALKTWDLSDKKKGGASKAINLGESRLEAQRKLIEEEKRLKLEKEKFDLDMRQKEIDNMQDSFDKRLRQLSLNLEKEHFAIREYEAKAAREQQDYLKDKYKSAKGDDKGFESYYKGISRNGFKDKDGKNVLPEWLTPESVAQQTKKLTDAAKNAQTIGLREVNKDLSFFLLEQQNMFKSDLEKKLIDLDAYYDERLIKAGNNANDIALIESNRSRSKTEAKTTDTLSKLDFNEQLEKEQLVGMESIGMTELVESKKLEITKKYIELRINALEKLALSGDQEAYKEIEKLKASLKNLDLQKPAKSLKSFADEKLFNVVLGGFQKMGDSEDTAKEKAIGLFSAITKNAESVAETVGMLQTAFGGLSEELDDALSMVGNIANGFAQGGIVGGVMSVIGEGVKLLSSAAEAEKKQKEVVKEIEAAAKAQEKAYKLMLRIEELKYKIGDTIFGSDSYGKALNSLSAYYNIAKDLDKLMKGSGEIEVFKGFETVKREFAELEKIQIKTGSHTERTGFLGLKKKQVDDYSSILSVGKYKDLVDANGKFNISLAESIIQSEKMSDGHKAALQNIIDNAKLAEDAYKGLSDYLTNIFGQFGNQLADSLVEAFDRGESASKAFNKSISSMLKNLVEDIINSAAIMPIVDKYKKEFEALFREGEDPKEQLRKVDNLLGRLEKELEGGYDFAKQIYDAANKSGRFDKDKNPQSSSRGGFETATQDQVGELSGRLTGVYESCLRQEGWQQEQTLLLQQQIGAINGMASHFIDLRDIGIQQAWYLADVVKNTNHLGGMNELLGIIEKNTRGLVGKR